MLTLIDVEEMRQILAKYVAAYRTQGEAAKALDISPQFLSDMVTGRREVSQTVARKLGYIRDYYYTERKTSYDLP